MATYVMSDLHGEYDLYRQMLKKIRFSDRDTLYVIGDVVDRGEKPIEILQDMMMRPNVFPLIGNHEIMALECLRFLSEEITEESIGKMDAVMTGKLLDWQANGGESTIRGFTRLDEEARQDILDYLEEFEAYTTLSVSGRKFLLVHAGLQHFSPRRPLDDYSIDELVWQRPDYDKDYYPDIYVISGHTPVMAIPDNPHPDRIYRKGHFINIDCGATFGGRLACLCLDTDEEFYCE